MSRITTERKQNEQSMQAHVRGRKIGVNLASFDLANAALANVEVHETLMTKDVYHLYTAARAAVTKLREAAWAEETAALERLKKGPSAP